MTGRKEAEEGEKGEGGQKGEMREGRRNGKGPGMGRVGMAARGTEERRGGDSEKGVQGGNGRGYGLGREGTAIGRRDRGRYAAVLSELNTRDIRLLFPLKSTQYLLCANDKTLGRFIREATPILGETSVFTDVPL